MKYLILPDVHNRCQIAEDVIKSVKPDMTVFLGDIFDDFYDDPIIIRDVAHWFKESVHKKDRIHLCGNHDVHYWFKENIGIRCSGYDQHKSIAINDILTDKDWEKLQFFYVLDNKWLLSHAGVHPVWIDNTWNRKKITQGSLSFITNKLAHDSVEAIKLMYSKRENWFTCAGFSRSHRSNTYGGLLWCDWNQEFSPMKGVNQIVGHTPCRNLKWVVVQEGADKYDVLPLEGVVNPTLTDTTSHNICIDSHPGSQYYAIYENGALTINHVKDMK